MDAKQHGLEGTKAFAIAQRGGCAMLRLKLTIAKTLTNSFMPIRIKPLIIEMFSRNNIRDFRLFPSKRGGHWFRRECKQPYFEFIVVTSSQKYKALACDIAWGFFPDWDGVYRGDQMRWGTSLSYLKFAGREGVQMSDTYYGHDGTEDGIRRALAQIGDEIVTYAMPRFDGCKQKAETDPLLRYGLNWLREHDTFIPVTIQEELNQAYEKASFSAPDVELPIFEALKSDLREFAHKIAASSEERKSTRRLAENLLEYAGSIKQGSIPPTGGIQ